MYQNKIFNLNLDKKYTDSILDNTDLFRNVHPNYLTITGLLIDFIILWAVFNQLLLVCGLSLFFRYTCDCLDGAVARKYKKVSNLGGFLDTLADNTLIFIVSFSIAFLLNFSQAWVIAVFITISNIIYLILHSSFIHHHGIKKGGNLIQSIYTFGVNNNCIIYFLIFATIGILL